MHHAYSALAWLEKSGMYEHFAGCGGMAICVPPTTACTLIRSQSASVDSQSSVCRKNAKVYTMQMWITWEFASGTWVPTGTGNGTTPKCVAGRMPLVSSILGNFTWQNAFCKPHTLSVPAGHEQHLWHHSRTLHSSCTAPPWLWRH